MKINCAKELIDSGFVEDWTDVVNVGFDALFV